MNSCISIASYVSDSTSPLSLSLPSFPSLPLSSLSPSLPLSLSLYLSLSLLPSLSLCLSLHPFPFPSVLENSVGLPSTTNPKPKGVQLILRTLIGM